MDPTQNQGALVSLSNDRNVLKVSSGGRYALAKLVGESR